MPAGDSLTSADNNTRNNRNNHNKHNNNHHQERNVSHRQNHRTRSRHRTADQVADDMDVAEIIEKLQNTKKYNRCIRTALGVLILSEKAQRDPSNLKCMERRRSFTELGGFRWLVEVYRMTKPDLVVRNALVPPSRPSNTTTLTTHQPTPKPLHVSALAACIAYVLPALPPDYFVRGHHADHPTDGRMFELEMALQAPADLLEFQHEQNVEGLFHFSKSAARKATRVALSALWENHMKLWCRPPHHHHNQNNNNTRNNIHNDGNENNQRQDETDTSQEEYEDAAAASQSDNFADLRGYLPVAIALILKMARESRLYSTDLHMVGSICQTAGLLSVDQGVLSIVQKWMDSKNLKFVETSIHAMTSLANTEDPYEAGCVHTQLVKLLPSVRQVAFHPRPAVARLLESLFSKCPRILPSLLGEKIFDVLLQYLQATKSTTTSMTFGKALDGQDDTQVLRSAVRTIVMLLKKVVKGSTGGYNSTMFPHQTPWAANAISQHAKDTLISKIVKGASLVSHCKSGDAEIRDTCMEALFVLSHDRSHYRCTRLILCDIGAAQALGNELNRLLSQNEPQDRMQRTLQTLEALCRVLDSEHEIANGIALGTVRDPPSILGKVCLETIQGGTLDSLLQLLRDWSEKATSVEDHEHSASLPLARSACQALATLSPELQSSPKVAAYRKYARTVLAAFLAVLQRQRPGTQNRQPLQSAALKGVAALAKSPALQSIVIDQALSYTMELEEPSTVVNHLVQSLHMVHDANESDSAGRNAKLLTDLYCFERSLLLQSMALDEIRRSLQDAWISELPEDGSLDKIRHALLKEEDENDKIMEKRKRNLLVAFDEIYGQDDDLSLDNARSDGFLARHAYPLNCVGTERDWILRHKRAMEEALPGTASAYSEHVERLAKTIFPSKLLRDTVMPLRVFPKNACDFKGLIMPASHYASFDLEGKMISRIYDNFHRKMTSGTSALWNLGFRNSTFGDDFVVGLSQCLASCPRISSISFEADSKHDDPGSKNFFACLLESLPPHVIHLSFDGFIQESHLNFLAKTLDCAVCGLDIIPPVTARAISSLAIKNSKGIPIDVWKNVLGSLKTANRPTGALRDSHFCSLKRLDLSHNGLGDEVCSLALSLCKDVTSPIEEIDLSGNCIGEGQSFLPILKKILQCEKRCGLVSLRLASNKLSAGYAWLEILRSCKGVRLKMLDLADNGISLDQGTDSISDEVTKLLPKAPTDITKLLSSGIEFLDLSNNCLSHSKVDQLRKFLRGGAAAATGMLSLRCNVPALEQVQERDLDDINKRAKRNILVDLCNAMQDPAPVSCTNSIILLVSDPIVFSDLDGRIHPVPPLNFEDERETIFGVLREEKKEIELSIDNATKDRFQYSMAKGGTLLHYSGHGNTEHLWFEDDKGRGKAELLEIGKIQEVMSPDSMFQCVFVSACQSQPAGQHFVAAGVPHVVCCDQESDLKDRAALKFTRHFYKCLITGSTVQKAFDASRRAVEMMDGLTDPGREAKKFQLLPRDGSHDRAIFDAADVEKWPPRSNPVSGSARSSEQVTMKMIHTNPCPAPSNAFIGREIETYNVLSSLLDTETKRNLVCIVGEQGIGRSSLVRRVCHYINSRKSVVENTVRGIYYVEIKEGWTPMRLFPALLEKLIDHIGDDTCSTKNDNSELEKFCSLVNENGHKCLVALDECSRFSSEEELKHLMVRVCEETHNRVKFLVDEHIQCSTLSPHTTRLQPLTFRLTFHLFCRLSDIFGSTTSRNSLLRELVSEDEEEQIFSKTLSPKLKRLFHLLGDGNPALILSKSNSFALEHVEESILESRFKGITSESNRETRLKEK